MDGNTMKRHRKAAGVTQVELAAMLGTTQPQICRWEQKGTDSIRTIQRIAEALGLPARVLLLDALDD
jgi:transcriptional regulator with XRE-family HTH domain